jgi:primosomal replication protein N
MNEVAMSGVLCDFGALRFTPAGIAVAEFSLRHESTQLEAGHPRRVALTLPAIAFGASAQRLADVAQQGALATGASSAGTITARGFLARLSARSSKIVLHANTIEFE